MIFVRHIFAAYELDQNVYQNIPMPNLHVLNRIENLFWDAIITWLL